MQAKLDDLYSDTLPLAGGGGPRGGCGRGTSAAGAAAGWGGRANAADAFDNLLYRLLLVLSLGGSLSAAGADVGVRSAVPAIVAVRRLVGAGRGRPAATASAAAEGVQRRGGTRRAPLSAPLPRGRGSCGGVDTVSGDCATFGAAGATEQAADDAAATATLAVAAAGPADTAPPLGVMGFWEGRARWWRCWLLWGREGRPLDERVATVLSLYRRCTVHHWLPAAGFTAGRSLATRQKRWRFWLRRRTGRCVWGSGVGGCWGGSRRWAKTDGAGVCLGVRHELSALYAPPCSRWCRPTVCGGHRGGGCPGCRRAAGGWDGCGGHAACTQKRCVAWSPIEPGVRESTRSTSGGIFQGSASSSRPAPLSWSPAAAGVAAVAADDRSTLPWVWT